MYLHIFSSRDSAIAFTDRIKSGVVGEQLWLQISEPTEKDKGKYAIEFFDGKGGLKRTIELAGQGIHAHTHIQTHTIILYFRLFYVLQYSCFTMLFFLFIITAYDDAYAEFQRLK